MSDTLTPAEQLEQAEAPTIYNYDRQLGFFTGTGKADLDPLTFQTLQKIEWLVPAKATLIPPPPFDPETQVALFNEQTQSWTVMLRQAAEDLGDDSNPLELTLEQQRFAALRTVDEDVDAITFATIGNRATEYLEAEAQARSFKQRGYPDMDVPAMVEDDMLAFGRTAQEAADAILAQAALWRQVQSAMRRQRLLAKQALRNAADVQDLAAALDQWHTTAHNFRQQLGV